MTEVREINSTMSLAEVTKLMEANKKAAEDKAAETTTAPVEAV